LVTHAGWNVGDVPIKKRMDCCHKRSWKVAGFDMARRLHRPRITGGDASVQPKETPMKNYYTLAVRDAGLWSPQFGDYHRSVVVEERTYMVDSEECTDCDCKIVRSGDAQADIDAAIAALNA
jgi:hypothetical protein